MSQRAAEAVVIALLEAPTMLVDMPRMGARVEGILDEEVRRVIVREYELRYRIEGEIIRILRIFHTRESR
jgi:plasmid stabilization system protein ParE